MATNNSIIEIQRTLNDMNKAVGRIEGQVGAFIEQMKAQDDRTTDLEVRTRKVENRQYWFTGAGTILGGLFSKYAPGLFGHG